MEDLSIYEQSNLLYTQERLSGYQPGGYHPICLGDTFKNGRYEIQHELGWGGLSTVWLANNQEREQWVTLKIMTAESTTSQGSRELHSLQFLRKYGEGRPASKYIVSLLDYFTHQGPNGTHQCLVFLHSIKGNQVSELDRRLSRREPNPVPTRLALVIRKLMRFVPSSRMEASEALELLRSEHDAE